MKQEHTLRITPARAGTTIVSQAVAVLAEDHPRSRGNNLRPQEQGKNRQGSPPLAREQPQPVYRRFLLAGITPARAGTTAVRRLVSCYSWDHPRSRGNNIRRRGAEMSEWGSPPLAREQLVLDRHSDVISGITPALQTSSTFLHRKVKSFFFVR